MIGVQVLLRNSFAAEPQSTQTPDLAQVRTLAVGLCEYTHYQG